MLTDEQRAIRATGIGASEGAALLELHPYKTALDVWLVKPTPTRAPLVVEGESPRTEVGSVLEEGLLELYRRRTGRKATRPQTTLRHPTAPHVLASPDALVEDDDRGAEIKLVGAQMAHHWADFTVPDYVDVQARQNMAVTGRSRWDVIALIGGTDFRIHTLQRDPEFEEGLVDVIESFWDRYIEGDEPPPIRTYEERQRYLRARYPGSDATKCPRVDDPKVEKLVLTYARASLAVTTAEARKKRAANALLGFVGDGYGIEGPWGRFIAPAIAGRVDWQAVATELAGGTIDTAIAEKHRGEGFRAPRLLPPKKEKRR